MVERADNQSLPQAEGRHVDGEEPCVTLDAFLEQSNATAVRLEPDEDARALIPYHTALARGTDVDKPRNLAKSVTVE